MEKWVTIRGFSFVNNIMEMIKQEQKKVPENPNPYVVNFPPNIKLHVRVTIDTLYTSRHRSYIVSMVLHIYNIH